MIEKCFDEGTIQAFLDGELDLQTVDKVTNHIALCDSCALAVSEAEEEMEFAFSAFDNEFNTLVPTERLWTKINNSIEAESKSRSIWQSVFAFLTNPSTVAFASLLIVFGLFVGLYSVKDNSKNELTAKNNSKPKVEIQNVNITDSLDIPGKKASPASPGKSEPQNVPQPRFVDNKRDEEDSEFKVRKAIYVPENSRRAPKPRIEDRTADTYFEPENLVAEESYVKTISTLEKTVNNRKDEVLRPSARFAFERDIAVADDTIKKMKDEVRKNPKNEAARVLLRNSYQNKIDLLNSVAEKTELMASLN